MLRKPLATLLLFFLIITCMPTMLHARDPIPPQELHAIIKENKGKVVVVNFWATWCAPCRIEIPDLIQLRNNTPDSDLFLIGVALDFDPDAPFAYAKRVKINYPVHWAEEDVINAFDVGAIPKTMIWDRTGKLVIEHEGLLDYQALKHAVTRLTSQ